MSTAYRRRRLGEAEREQRRGAERERVKEAAEQLLTSEGWQRWARARSMFRRYSWLIWRTSVLARKESADLRRRHVIKRLRPDPLSARNSGLGAEGPEVPPPGKKEVQPALTCGLSVDAAAAAWLPLRPGGAGAADTRRTACWVSSRVEAGTSPRVWDC